MRVKTIRDAARIIEEQLGQELLDFDDIKSDGQKHLSTHVQPDTETVLHYDIVEHDPRPGEIPPTWKGFGWTDNDSGWIKPGAPFPKVGQPHEHTHENSTLEAASVAAADWLASALAEHRRSGNGA